MRKKMETYNDRPNSYKEVGTRTQIYNNNTSSFIQTLGFLSIVGAIAAIAYGIVTSFNTVATGVSEHTTNSAIDGLWASVGWAVFIFGGIAGFILLIVIVVLLIPFVVKVLYKVREMKDEQEFNRKQLRWELEQQQKQLGQLEQHDPLMLEDKQYGIKGTLKIVNKVQQYDEEYAEFAEVEEDWR